MKKMNEGSDEPQDILAKYRNVKEHNIVVGMMIQLIGVGLGSERAQGISATDALYINKLLAELRR